jgi:metal-responsive CopG/Arc/MetJ family transcriptional regulator
MPSVKTAISIDADLFQQVEAASEELHVSRSQLFALAMEDFLRRRQNRELLNRLNDAYSEAEFDADERDRLKRSRKLYRRTLEDQW